MLVSALLGMVMVMTLFGASSAGADGSTARLSAANRKLAEKQKAFLDPQTVRSPETATKAGKKAAATEHAAAE